MAVASSSLVWPACELPHAPPHDSSLTSVRCSSKGLGLGLPSSDVFRHRKELRIHSAYLAFLDDVQGYRASKTYKFPAASTISAVLSRNQASVVGESSVSGSPNPGSYRVALAYGPGPLDKSADLETDVKEPKSEDVPEVGGGGGGSGNGRGGGGSGGGGGGDGGDEAEEGKNKEAGMSVSQRLTLVYAGVVGAGGFIGYLKSGSTKSLAAGLGSAAVLTFVYSQLPTNPVLASSVGLGVSVALLTVMGSRFRNSGKVMPAGIVSLLSLIMTGGYVHGIIRSSHHS